jgi:hypothetical protein
MGTDPLSTMTLFVTQMLGLSVAAERVTETIKQWISPAMKGSTSARYAAVIQTIAIMSGIFVTALSGLNPLNVPGFKAFAWSNSANWMCWLVGGLLVCGGSAFWNHVLDILQAAKVQKEQLANTMVASASIVSSSAVTVMSTTPNLNGPAIAP